MIMIMVMITARAVPRRNDEEATMKFTAVFQKVPEGYIAFVEEARENLNEAIQLVLDANRAFPLTRPFGSTSPAGGEVDYVRDVILSPRGRGNRAKRGGEGAIARKSYPH
jgi:hypothetical protein